MPSSENRYLIGVDIGGTFTDLTLAGASGQSLVLKVPSDPRQPERAVHAALKRAADDLGVSLAKLLADTELLVHGTTIATNTVITRTGPRVGLICNEGFRDVLALRDGFKPDRYNLRLPVPGSLVPRRLRVGVKGRIDYAGTELEPVDEQNVREALEALRREGAEVIVVSLLWSMLNPAHERQVGEVVAREAPDLPVTLSSDVLPILGEWKRTSGAVLSGYIKPRISRYLRRLEADLAEGGLSRRLFVMQVNGGAATVDEIEQTPVYAVHSGPAAGPAAGARIAREADARDLIVVDMGGTSFDVALMTDGHAELTGDLMVADMPVGVQALEIASIGAGGGSIAWVDSGGALRVGPQSAGSDPGPACYGKGGELPTVTDADLLLGYLDESNPLGGELELDRELAERALATIAEPLGLTVPEAAQAIFTVVNTNMVEAIKLMSVKRGLDPREYALVVGGGAGPVHGAKLAQMLDIETTMVPREAGGFCALGMISADVRHDYVQAVELRTSDDGAMDAMDAVYRELEEKARSALVAEGFREEVIAFKRTADARYVGQFHDITVPVPSDGRLGAEHVGEVLAAFHAEHRQLYTYAVEDAHVEFFHCRLAAFGRVPRFAEAFEAAPPADPDAARKAARPVYSEWTGAHEPVTVYSADDVPRGVDIAGPAILERETTTIVVHEGQSATVNDRGTTVIRSGVPAAESPLAVAGGTGA